MPSSCQWMAIETAPKDGSRLLLWTPGYRGMIAIGAWSDDRYSRRPRPFWSFAGFRTAVARDMQPTHWMPLPEPPEQETRP